MAKGHHPVAEGHQPLGQSYDVDYGLKNGKIVNNVIPLPRHCNRSLETPPLKSAWYSMEKVVFWAHLFKMAAGGLMGHMSHE